MKFFQQACEFMPAPDLKNTVSFKNSYYFFLLMFRIYSFLLLSEFKCEVRSASGFIHKTFISA